MYSLQNGICTTKEITAFNSQNLILINLSFIKFNQPFVRNPQGHPKWPLPSETLQSNYLMILKMYYKKFENNMYFNNIEYFNLL